MGHAATYYLSCCYDGFDYKPRFRQSQTAKCCFRHRESFSVEVSMKKIVSGLGFLALLISSQVFAGSELLLKSDQAWDGGKFAYPKGKPEITSVKLSLEMGKDTPFHCHPIPTMGYISRGKVLVETKDGKSMEVKQGDSVVEVMKTVHRGLAIENDAEIIVFYAGAKQIPVTVLESDQENFKKFCQ